jgi:hypothetical protein
MRLIVLTLFLLAACKPDCELESCPSGKQYQGCVEGKDLVIRTASGAEFSRCTTDYPDPGSGVFVSGDKNNCAEKNAQSREAYCSGTIGSNGISASTGNTGSTGSTGNTGSTGSTGNPTGSAHCYKASDNGACDCKNYDASSEFSGRVAVASCSASVGLVMPQCCVVNDSAARATWCQCWSEPTACRDDGSSCSCPARNTTGDLSQVRSSCQPTGNRICCQSNSYCTCRAEQYAGAGCIGFGGFNEGASPVSACTAPLQPVHICGGGEVTSCDGLTWAP